MPSRRDFLRHVSSSAGTALATVALPTAGVSAHQALAEALRALAPLPTGERRTLHLIGYSHLDAAWLWPWRDGADSAITTFQSAIDRMAETPAFRFSAGSAIHYQWVEDADPRLFAAIRQRVAEGRWEVVGGWAVEPDCNLPSTESFVRQALYAKAYFRRTLGQDATIGLNPDSFGHAAGLPTILRATGYRGYVFSRPGSGEMALPRVFWWESPDGSRVLAWRSANYWGDSVRDIARAVENIFAPGLAHGAILFGVGNHGGGATREQIRILEDLARDPSLPTLRFSTLGDFMAAVEHSPTAATLPVVRTELQHHARGCYAALGEIKALNRRAEYALGRSETVSTLAHLAAERAYPRARYHTAWETVSFNQFHDLLAGTALYADYVTARDSLGGACWTADDTAVRAVETLARRVDTSRVSEGALFLLNALPWPRTVEANIVINDDLIRWGGDAIGWRDEHGTALPVQWRAADSMTVAHFRLATRVELPACGYRVLEMTRGPVTTREPWDVAKMIAASRTSPPDTMAASTPHGDWFRVDPQGGLSSLRAADGTELLSAPIGLVVIEDTSDTWAHEVASFRTELGRPAWAASELVEQGPVRRTWRQRATWRASRIVLEITERPGDDVLELRFVIDWREHEQILKLEVPTVFTTPRLLAQVAGATIERATTGDEESAQDYVALEGTVGGAAYTVALLNGQTYSYDCLRGLLRTVLIRSAPYARHNPSPVTTDDANAWQDQGRQERTFWLLAGGGGGGHAADLPLARRAREVQTPAEYMLDGPHVGVASWSGSYLAVAPESVVATAIKWAEDRDALVVRLQETAGRDVRATLASPAFGWSHEVALAPWSLVTVRIDHPTKRGASLQLTTALEEG